jgi:hypothetical protein
MCESRRLCRIYFSYVLWIRLIGGRKSTRMWVMLQYFDRSKLLDVVQCVCAVDDGFLVLV